MTDNPSNLGKYVTADTCEGKGRDGVVFPNRFGHYATPPGVSTWFSGAVARCMAADDQFRR